MNIQIRENAKLTNRNSFAAREFTAIDQARLNLKAQSSVVRAFTAFIKRHTNAVHH